MAPASPSKPPSGSHTPRLVAVAGGEDFGWYSACNSLLNWHNRAGSTVASSQNLERQAEFDSLKTVLEPKTGPFEPF
jgi:hypothetical protein